MTRSTILLLLILSAPFYAAAQSFESVEQIRSLVTAINSEKHYQTKVLENDEFIDGTDRGSSLTGYFKDGELDKVIEWIGISNCLSVREFYYNDDQIAFISHFGTTWAYDDKKNDFDYNLPKKNLQSRFYFSNGNLLKYIEGSATTECTGLDSLQDTTELLRLSKRYKILLGFCPDNNGTGKLIPIDVGDTSTYYQGLAAYVHDTVTKGGWKIKYQVKDDCTKSDDVYVQWSKGKKRNDVRMHDALNFKSYFIPQYVGENESYIFLTHACATQCSALLVLNKDSMTSTDYSAIAGYNIPTGQIVYVPQSNLDNDMMPFNVVVVNLNNHQEKVVKFKNLCRNVEKTGCIDSVVFKKNKVTITATLSENNEAQKEVRETTVVTFE